MFPLEIYEFFRSSHWKCFMKKAFLKTFVIHRKVADLQLHLKETPTEVFSSEYCEIFKNTYFEESLLAATSEFLKQKLQSTHQLLLLY